MQSQPGSALGGAPSSAHKPIQGGRFDFDDGGMYCGGWEDGKAHGHGVCTGLKGQGEYSGSWNYGFEVSGVYTWPGGSTYEGHWQNGKRHGLGVETRGRWIYRGEWTQGFKGRYGVRQSLTSAAKYDGTWANGLQDGYGSETYADSGTYQGQWLRGMRHGYGVRTSAAFGMASRFRPKSANIRSSMSSLRSGVDGNGSGADPAADRDKRLDDGRGGFVLKARSDEPPARRRSFSERSTTIKKSLFQGLRLKKQHSTGELEKRGTSSSIRSTGSSASWRSTESSQSGMTNVSQHTDSNASFVAEDEQLDASVTETYMGEWKNDKRAGFGISERSDGLKYEGEWFNNKKYGYGVTTFKDGTKEEGKYKNNVLITSQKKKHLFLIRSAKFRERIEAALSAAQRASKIALQKADIAISRTSTARGKAELADMAAMHAREDAEYARIIAKQLAPDFQPCSETMRPVLPSLARLTAQSSQAAAKAAPFANNVPPHHAHQSHHHHRRDGSTDRYMMDRDAPTPTPTTPHSLSRMDDYSASLALPAASTDLTRRPSVAIGGVRSPKGADEAVMMRSANHMAYAESRAPNVPHGHYPPTSSAYAPAGNPSFDSGVYTAAEESDHRSAALERGRSSLRRHPPLPGFRAASGGAPVTNYMELRENPSFNFQQAMNDHFDHYKRTPSRDRSRDPSMDRFSRSSRMSLTRTTETYSRGHSPASSVVSGPINPRSLSRQRPSAVSAISGLTPSSSIRLDTPTNENIGFGPMTSSRRPTLQHSELSTGNGSIPGTPTPTFGLLQQPSQPTNSVEEMLLRQRLGQEIPKDYSANSPKRTESLYIAPARKKEKAAPAPTPKRKKSLPDASAAAAAAASVMSREEASVLSSQRREEIRRQVEEAERYRANPLLYFVSPQVKGFFIRQQLTLIILVINVSLAFLFFKLLT